MTKVNGILVRQRVKQAELARRMRLSPTQVNRMVNIRQTTKIDTISAAFKALGKQLDFVVVGVTRTTRGV